MQPKSETQPISQLPDWLHMLAAVYPPQQVALVGAGNGTGVLVQCLQSLASTSEPGGLPVTLLEPHAPSMAQLNKRLAGQGSPSRCADWQLRPDAVAPTEGDHTYHHYSLATENSLLPPEALHSLWSSLQLQAQQLIPCVPLASLLPASWLLVDCLPAAHLLQGTPLPASTQVVLTRVVLGDTAAPGTRWDEVANLLALSGFKAVATFAERNSALGKALFVRDPKGLQAQIEQLAQTKDAETTAKLAETKAKAELQNQLDQAKQALQAEAKAKEAEMSAKLAEAQARSAEQHAKEQALSKVQDLLTEKVQLLQAKEQVLAKVTALEADKAQLTDAKDKALAHVQQLEQGEAQALRRCDELAKAKEAEIAAKQAETQAKAALQTQLDQVKQNLEAETVAKRAEMAELRKELQSVKTKLQHHETLFQATLTMGSEPPTQLRFNSKSEGIYKNKQGIVRFDLPGNTPAYLVSNEAGDFDIAPKLKALLLQPNKAYEFTGTVVCESATQPVIWLFEYDENNKKINSYSYPTQNGEFRAIFKTQANAASYAIGIRLGGAGSLYPQNTVFRFESSLAIEVAEAMKHSNTGLETKLTELQAKLQKEQKSQNENSLRQIESFLRLQSYCGDRIVLPDMHGWPVSPDLGVYIIRLVEAGGFDAIVEFGSGVSTLLIALALQKAADSHAKGVSTSFVSFEHLESYLQQTQAQLHQAQLSETVQLVYAPLVETAGAQNNASLYYDCQATLTQLRLSIPKPNPKLLVFVDGPPAATGPLARFPAMPSIERAFDGCAEVHYLMDDYIRQDERDIVAHWQAHLVQQGRQVEKQELKQFEKQACLLITKAQS